MNAPALRAATVRVPCSTSNLGSGFDVLGLALDAYLEAGYDPGADASPGGEASGAGTISRVGGLALERAGTLAGVEEDAAHDLLATAFRSVLEAHGVTPSGVIRARSEVPLARGLGSSAMALVAGHALARAALGLEPSAQEAFDAATREEQHGDNAAPCAFGGLRAVIPADAGPHVVGLPLSATIGFAYAAPAIRVSTHAARGALPTHVAHPTAVLGHGRFAALLQGLATGDPELIKIGFTDELHVPYRLPLIPNAQNAISAGYEAGAWGVTISGSGSGLIALCAPDRSDAVAATMKEVFVAGGDDEDCWAMALRPDHYGVVARS